MTDSTDRNTTDPTYFAAWHRDSNHGAVDLPMAGVAPKSRLIVESVVNRMIAEGAEVITEQVASPCHWHLTWDDDGRDYADISTDVFGALASAENELDILADYEREGAEISADAGDYQEAWEQHKKSEQLYNLRDNVSNVVNQHFGGKPRAPLYPDDAQGNAKLLETALWIADQVNEGSSLQVYSCTDPECWHDDDHHIWGPVEIARFTGNPHRKCTVCDVITLDLTDSDD